MKNVQRGDSSASEKPIQEYLADVFASERL